MDPLQSVVGAHAEEAVSAPRFFIVPGIKGREEDGDGGQSPRQESPLIDGLPEPIVVSRWPPCCAWQSDKFSLFANFEESTQYLFPSFGSWRFYYMTIRKDWKSDQWRSNSLGCSLGRTTDERTKREKHESFMKALLGSEEVPPLAPVIPGTNCFNPVLEKFWLPWARAYNLSLDIQITYMEDPLYMAWGTFSLHCIRQQIAWSVPTLPVLRYMVQTAPGGRILDVGAGTGYWSALLAGLGADVKAVDNFSWWPRQAEDGDSPEARFRAQRPLYFDVQEADAADYVSVANAENRALFFSWPKGVMKSYMEGYTGDVIFWVGEDEGTTEGVWTGYGSGWLLERTMKIPQWPGLMDHFAAYTRLKLAETEIGQLLAGS